MALRSLSTAALRAELARREKGAAKLQKKHTTLSRVLATLEAELAGLGAPGAKRRGRPPGSKNKRRGRKPGRPKGRRGPGRPPKMGRRRRASNKLTLPEALAKAVRVGSTVSPADAAAAVRKAGYKTASKTFGIQVATTLARSSAFKKTGRGAYLRKGTAGRAAPAKRGRKPKMGRKTRKPSKRGRKAARRSPKAARKAATPKPVVAPTIVV